MQTDEDLTDEDSSDENSTDENSTDFDSTDLDVGHQRVPLLLYGSSGGKLNLNSTPVRHQAIQPIA